MTDLVKVFEDYATLKGWQFAYGTRQILNYETSHKDLELGDKLLLMFPFTESAQINTNLNVIGKWRFNTQIWLGQKFDVDGSTGTYSELDETYEQKYERRLLGLRGTVREMFKDLLCVGGYEMINIQITREVNEFDENLDFVVVNLTVDVDNV
jgi:hypothetical protein